MKPASRGKGARKKSSKIGRKGQKGASTQRGAAGGYNRAVFAGLIPNSRRNYVWQGRYNRAVFAGLIPRGQLREMGVPFRGECTLPGLCRPKPGQGTQFPFWDGEGKMSGFLRKEKGLFLLNVLLSVI